MLIPVGIGLTVVWLLTNDADTSSSAPDLDPNIKKIVFIAGAPSHGPGEHEFYAGCKLLADHLDRSGLPVKSVIVRNGWPKDESIFDGASAVVIYVDG
ncbi:MAG: hypothetical protein ACO3RV_05045 [Luteolibacter sp.]